MSKLPIRLYGDAVLTTKAERVVQFGPDLKELATDMFETMYAAPGVGLAANQVGYPLAMFVYDDGKGHKGIVCNPRLRHHSVVRADEEGCLSIPGFYLRRERARLVRLVGVDQEGRFLTFAASGLLARIVQHEVDHLRGRFFAEPPADLEPKVSPR